MSQTGNESVYCLSCSNHSILIIEKLSIRTLVEGDMGIVILNRLGIICF